MIRTFAAAVSGQAVVARVAEALIEHSQWFTVEPLPDDVWEVSVKIENRSMLLAQINGEDAA